MKKMKDQAEEIPGDLTKFFSKLAKKYGVWLVPGSMYERSGDDVFNTTLVFSPKGEIIGKYRKRYPWCPYEKTKPGKDPFVLADRALGEWNSFRIVQVGSRTSVWMNDYLIVDNATMENYFDRGAPLPVNGPIVQTEVRDPT